MKGCFLKRKRAEGDKERIEEYCKNLKTKGRICLLPAHFMRILQSLRETLLSPLNFSKQPTPDENNLYQGKP
jgi:hypothetical protein